MRAEPSTCTTAGMRALHSGRTLWVNSMYGLGRGPSKISAARAALTMGATGRNSSRPLTAFSRSRLPAGRGSARRLRWPSARGPNSLRPWNQATMPSAARHSATVSATSRGRSNATLADVSHASMAASSQLRPSAAVGIGCTQSPIACATYMAAPSAVPESPAAGWT